MFPFLRASRPWAAVPAPTPPPLVGGIQVMIGEPSTFVDRTGMVDFSRLGFTLNRGQTGTGNVPLLLNPTQSYDPQVDWPVFIYEVISTASPSTTRVFAGLIQTRDKEWEGNQGHLRIGLTCVGLEAMFDAAPTPIVEYTATATGDIFTALFNSATWPVGVTLGTIGSGVVVDSRKYDGKSSVLSAMQQLATDSGYILYIDPATLTVNFHGATDVPAPFVMDNGMALYASVKWKQNKSNFRDKVVIQLDPNILPYDTATFTGDGVTKNFTLPYPAVGLSSASVTTSTQSFATGTFTSQPLPGDNFTITPPAGFGAPRLYVFVAVLDNTVDGQILIGPTVADTAQNAVDAINGNFATIGTAFSSPTWTNSQVVADAPSGASFVIHAKTFGRNGDLIALGVGASVSPPPFTWDVDALSGGADNSTKGLSIGPVGAGTFDVTFTPGTAGISAAKAPATGATLVVNYRRVGTGSLALQNSSASSLNLNSQFSVMFARNANTVDAVVQQASAALAATSVLPAELNVEMDIPGISPGMYWTWAITVPVNAGTVVNGNWIVQSVTASIPSPGWEKLPDDIPGPNGRYEPGGHFRYAIQLFNTTDVNTEQDFWKDLADKGPQDAAVVPEEPIAGPVFGMLYKEPLMLKDTTVGTNIADIGTIVTPHDQSVSPEVIAVGKGKRLIAVCRIEMSADLTVQFRKEGLFSSPPTSMSWTITIPAHSPTGTMVVEDIEGDFNDLDEVYVDVLASDGTTDVDGVASYLLVWEMPAQ